MLHFESQKGFFLVIFTKNDLVLKNDVTCLGLVLSSYVKSLLRLPLAETPPQAGFLQDTL